MNKTIFILAVLMATALVTSQSAFALKTFTTKNAEENYTFQYPNNWKSEKLNRFHNFDARVVLGGNDVQMNFESGSPFEYLILDTNDTEGTLSSLETLATSLFNDGYLEESGADKYIINGHPAPYVIVTFETDPGLFGGTLDMVGMVTLVTLSDNEVVIVQYVTEEDDFDRYLSKAEQVLQSITPTGVVSEQPETELQPTSDNGGDSKV